MNAYKIVMFILYFTFVTGIGVFFFIKSKDKNGKDYFLGGRKMNGFVAALSAGASDMSAWVLMGLPGAICLFGLGQVWISVGLLVGTVLSWIFVAPKLRRFAIKSNDSITIPEYLSNRFNSKSPVLRISCAVIFLIGYCLYAASSIAACGTVIVAIIPSANKVMVEIIAAAVIVAYTFLGGFNAVCWTDFFQGLLMLVALMAVPIIAFIVLKSSGPVAEAAAANPNYYNFLSSGEFDWASVSDILTGFGWGLGYFGMPHILIRFMSVKSEKDMRRSQITGSVWTALILLFATFVGLIAHEYLGADIDKDNKSSVFIILVDTIFSAGGLAIIGGLLLSAIVAASMSTADSQLLLSSSAFAADIYKTTIKKDANDKEVLWVGRIAVIVLLVFAVLIALFVSSDIMSLVSAAWSIFGAAFGPVILLSLYWKRFNYKGAVAGIISGFLTSVLWMILFNLPYYGFGEVLANTNLYEIVPGFIVGLLVAVVTTLLTDKPDEVTEKIFDEASNMKYSDEQ